MSRQVIHIHLMGQAFAPSRPHTDKGHLLAPGPGGNGQLGPDLVAGVDHGIRPLTQQTGPVVGRDKVVDQIDPTARVNLRNAFAHGFDLGLPEGAGQRMDLAVDVGLGDVVHVDQRQACDAAARQRFG